MGRPVNKRYFGLLDDGTNLTINAKVGGNTVSESGYIIRQRSNNKFLVNDLKTGTKTSVGGTGTGNVSVCTLVDKPSGTLAADEMSLGAVIAATGQGVRIKRLYNRTARDFANRRFTWSISDDSTVSQLLLVEI